MCGIIAGVGKLNSNRIVALGSMSEERGTDSVGIGYVLDGEIKIAKIAERPCVGLNLSLRKEVTEAAVSGLFIGHTRAATQGAIVSENAHPFLMDGIAFAHNGIIINDEDFGKYDVDSQSLIHGIKDKDFSKYEGGIGLVWIEGGKLHAYRCGNPLFRGRHGDATYLASDDAYLEAIGCKHIKELAEGMIYTFNDAHNVTTKRVPKNKSYVYKKNWQDDAPLTTYQYSAGANQWKLDAPKLAGESQRDWWKEEKGLAVLDDGKTWKDERDAIAAANYDKCDMCGMSRSGEAEYCRDCMDWLKNEMNADSPSEVRA